MSLIELDDEGIPYARQNAFMESMGDVNRLTLELFTNKTQYNKYLSKNEPVEFQKRKEFRDKIVFHKDAILEKTEYLIHNMSNSPSVQEAFDFFVKEVIKDIEMNTSFNDKIYEEEEDDEEEEDNEMLFGVIDKPPSGVPTQSFWSGDKVFRQPSNHDAFLSHYPTNTSFRRRVVNPKKNVF
jgi:hypothetical protein